MATKNANRKIALGYATLTLILLGVPLTAFTQDDASQEATALALEEVVVTAERRESSLQETAISISAFSSNQIARSGIDNSEQLTGFTPGLNI